MDDKRHKTGSEPILRATGVEKHFGPVHALRKVDFEVRPGEIVAPIGDNGAGKSTFINVLTGVLQPDAGEIVFAGRWRRAEAPGTFSVIVTVLLVPWQSASANLRERKPGLSRVYQDNVPWRMTAKPRDTTLPNNDTMGRRSDA